MVGGVKPDVTLSGEINPGQPPADEAADLRAAIDAAEQSSLLSPEAFLRWLEGRGDELDSAPTHATVAQPRRNDSG